MLETTQTLKNKIINALQILKQRDPKEVSDKVVLKKLQPVANKSGFSMENTWPAYIPTGKIISKVLLLKSNETFFIFNSEMDLLKNELEALSGVDTVTITTKNIDGCDYNGCPISFWTEFKNDVDDNKVTSEMICFSHLHLGGQVHISIKF